MSWFTKQLKQLKQLRITTEPFQAGSDKATKKLAKDLALARQQELVRFAANKQANRKAALVNLNMAERYENMLSGVGLSKGRKSTLQGIVDVRVERAESLLGVEITNVSGMIGELELLLNGY